MWMDAQSDSAARSAQSPMRPRWPEFFKAVTATPCRRAFSTPRSTVCSPTVCPNP